MIARYRVSTFVGTAINRARLACLLTASVVAFSVPALMHSQPVPAPAAVTFAHNDTIPLSAAAIASADLAERSRMRPVKKGMRIGAVSGAILGLLASAELYSGGCDLSLPINADGSRGRRNCSTWKAGLAYGAFLSLVGGTAGGVIGAGVGAIVGAFDKPSEAPGKP